MPYYSRFAWLLWIWKKISMIIQKKKNGWRLPQICSIKDEQRIMALLMPSYNTSYHYTSSRINNNKKVPYSRFNIDKQKNNLREKLNEAIMLPQATTYPLKILLQQTILLRSNQTQICSFSWDDQAAMKIMCTRNENSLS